MNRPAFVLTLCFLIAGIIWACSPPAHGQGMVYPPAPEDANHPDTNPPAIRDWMVHLSNRVGGQCCGDGDGYPAMIDEQPTATLPGHGHVIDPSRKEIWVHGRMIKARPALKGDLNFTFWHYQETPETLGTPLTTAFVFLNVDLNTGLITPMPAWPEGVFCVVPLPPGS